MKKRLIQALLLSAMLVSLSASVAPVKGHKEIIETDVAAQIESTKELKNISLYSGFCKSIYNYGYINNQIEEVTIQKKDMYEGWLTENVNVRTEPSLNSEILEVKLFNTQITFFYYNNDWVEIACDDKQTAYISSQYITDIECPYIEYAVPNNEFKSYMPYNKTNGKSIFSKKSNQYKLQQMAYTGNYGIRMVKNRYCVAIGTAFNADIGTYFDLILENSTVIQCIVSDIKADVHTESNNMVTASNGCVSEFVVDKNLLPYKVYNKDNTGSGDISDCCYEWDSNVKIIKIYNKNIFE